MKKLPIYGLLILGYYWIINAMINYYNNVVVVEKIIIPQDVQNQSSLKIVPLLIISIFAFILIMSVGSYTLVVAWKWFKEHKTMIVLPFLAFLFGVGQLITSILTSIKMLIESNADQLVTNFTIYINATMELTQSVLFGGMFILASALYSIFLPQFEKVYNLLHQE